MAGHLAARTVELTVALLEIQSAVEKAAWMAEMTAVLTDLPMAAWWVAMTVGLTAGYSVERLAVMMVML